MCCYYYLHFVTLALPYNFKFYSINDPAVVFYCPLFGKNDFANKKISIRVLLKLVVISEEY